MGAEAAVRKWKRAVAKIRREKQKIEISPPSKSVKNGKVNVQST
jgi:hypothetical protein